MESVLMTVGSKKLYFTHVRTNDFSQIYKALQHSERKIPVHLLRALKAQIYNIVKTTEDADRRIAVKDFDEATAENSELEFVVGVGVAQNESGERIGLNGVGSWDILKDIIFDDLQFNDIDILQQVLPELSKKNRTYLPVQKYSRSNPTYKDQSDIQQTLRDLIGFDLEHYKKKIPPSVSRQFEKNWSLDEILLIEKIGEIECSLNKKLDFLALWLIEYPSKESCDLLREKFFSSDFDKLKSEADTTTLRRLICILDQVENQNL